MGCQECGLYLGKNGWKPFAPGIAGAGSTDAEILIITDAPKKYEDAQGFTLAGDLGRTLVEILKSEGLKGFTFRAVSAVRCRIAEDAPPTNEQCVACREYLAKEIAAMPNLKLLVPMGNTAYQALHAIPGSKKKLPGITKVRGEITTNPFFNLPELPTFSISAVRQSPKYEPLLREDLRTMKAFFSDDFGKKAPVNYTYVYDKAWLDKLFAMLRLNKKFVFDLETTSKDYIYGQKILCISFSWMSHTAVYLPMCINAGDNYWAKFDLEEYVYRNLKEIFEDPEIKKIGQNIKYDVGFMLATLGIDTQGLYFDTLTAHQNIDENTSHALDDLVLRYTDMGRYYDAVHEAYAKIKRDKNIPKSQKNYGAIDEKVLREYSCCDADATYRLYELFEPQIEQLGIHDLYYNQIVPAAYAFALAEVEGVCLDEELVKEKAAECHKRMEFHLDAIRKFTGNPDFNPSSSKQVGKFLYGPKEEGGLGLTPVKYTKTGAPAADEESIEALFTAHPENQDLKHILEYRGYQKLDSTYLTGLLKMIDPVTGRLHPNYQMTGTVTGRIVCKKPNLLNIPRDNRNDPDQIKVREIFIPPPGWCYVYADMSQAEFRVWAAISKDETMLKLFRDGVDIHRYVASVVHNVPIEEISKDDPRRDNAKGTVFGLMYGRGDDSVAKEYGIPLKDAQRIRKIFFNLAPKASGWLDDTTKFALKHGYVRNYFGRIRRLPELRSDSKGIRNGAERMAVNSPIQATASDIVVRAFTDLATTLRRRGFKAVPVFEIYDCIITACPMEEVVEVAKMQHEFMTRAIPGLDVPWKADLEIVDRWTGKSIDIPELAK